MKFWTLLVCTKNNEQKKRIEIENKVKKKKKQIVNELKLCTGFNFLQNIKKNEYKVAACKRNR